MALRRGSRPTLIVALFVAGVVGYVFTTPTGGIVVVPFDAGSGVAADAAIDAPPDSSIDAPPGDIPLLVAWERHPILSVATGSTLAGADGVHAADVNGDGRLDLTTGWEQSARSTVSLHPGCDNAGNPWSSVTLPGNVSGVEDAAWGDVDGDGRIDVLSAGSSGFRVTIQFAPALNADLLTPASWTSVVINASINTQRFLKSHAADLDGDAAIEVIAGGYSTGASLDVYRSATPRTATSWTRQEIADVGTVYGIETRDMDADGDLDIVMSDRDQAVTALRGMRWLENPDNPGDAWDTHPIYAVPNTRWFEISPGPAPWTVVMGTASNATGVSTYHILTSADGLTWSRTDITGPADVGRYNAARFADFDGDGDQDIALVFIGATGSLSNVVWLRNDGGNVWTRGEVSGPDGVKSDNFEVFDVDCDGDPDIVTTDEGVRGDGTVTPLGLVWYENPRA